MTLHNMHPWANQRLGPWGGGNAGPKWLSSALTINSITETAQFVFRGVDANLATWPATIGSDLAITGSGDDVVLAQATGFPLARHGVDLEEGKYFVAGSTSLGDVAEEDFVVELVLREAGGASVQYVVSKGDAANYWQIRNTAAGNIRFYAVGPGGSAVSSALTISATTWLHLMWFYDKSGSYQIYVNGSALGSAVACSSVGTLTNASPLTIGARTSTGGFPWDGALASLMQWKRTDWLDTHLQASVAAARYAELTGT